MSNDLPDVWPEQPPNASWIKPPPTSQGVPSSIPMRPRHPLPGAYGRPTEQEFLGTQQRASLSYQDTFPLPAQPLRDGNKRRATRHRRWWPVAIVAVSLLLLTTIVVSAIAVSRHDLKPTSPSLGIVTPTTQPLATATATTAVTASPAATPSAIATATSTTQPTATATATSPSSSPFALVFDDEFNGSSVNQNAWSLYSGQPGGNTATQWVPNLCREQGGMLVLPITAQPAKGRPLSACGMSGSQANTQTYGKYEYRARLDAGYDWYGMFLLWPNSGNWPTDGEIDNCEFDAGDVGRNHCAMTVHWAADNQQTQTHFMGDFTQWHTFTVTWLPASITYQIDGQTVWTETQHVPNTAMWPAFQVQGNGDATNLGAYYVDYIHIYKYTGS